MKRILVVLVAVLTCVSCHQKKTVQECEADYKKEIKQCELGEDACDNGAKMMNEKCKAIKDPAERKQCYIDAKAAKDACNSAKDKCMKDAKKTRDECKEEAANPKRK